jgi:Ca-activated chloride channel family protein
MPFVENKESIMRVKAKLAKEQYTFNKSNETHLMIELEAPKVEWQKDRAPICLIPVLDVSSSMMGEKIDYVRKACRKLVDNLAPGDFAGIVAYDSYVHEVAEIREITQSQKDELKKKIAGLRTHGCTNMSGGLACALKWINNIKINDNVILRVILFTDGLANIDVTGRNLLDFSKELCGKASVSTFGFGHDCDQELLADMANICNGNFAFIDSPDAAISAFARELGGLMSTYAQDIKICVSPDKNNEILEILNDEDVSDNNGRVTVNLRDILGEEKKWIVAKVRLNEVEKALPRKVNAFKIEVSYKDKEHTQQTIDEISVKVGFCKLGEEPTEEDAQVVRQRDMLLAAKAQDQAEAFARIGNYQGAQQTLYACSVTLSDANVKSVMDNLSINYADQGSYTGSRGLTNSLRSHMKGKRISYTSHEAQSLCSTIGAQNSTAMDDMETNFATDLEASDSTDIGVVNMDSIKKLDIYKEDDKSKTAKKRKGEDW